jgi:hypothetical protein
MNGFEEGGRAYKSHLGLGVENGDIRNVVQALYNHDKPPFRSMLPGVER